MSSPKTISRDNARTSVIVAVAIAMVLAWLPGPASGQDRFGDSTDPVLAAVDISQRTFAEGTATFAIIGRDDVFADNLAATPLAGPYGTILYTAGGADAPLRDETLAEVERALGAPDERPCEAGRRADVYLVGGTEAISEQVEQTLVDDGWCTRRLAGATRVETSVAIADEVGGLSGQVLLARGDSFADAAAVSSHAARTNSRILITPSSGLPDVLIEALTRYEPEEIVLLGGDAALSAEVADQAAAIAPTRRVAGVARDATAVAIADELWEEELIRGFFVGHGFASSSWGFLFAAGPYGAQRGLPILYADGDGPTAVSQERIDRRATEFGAVPLGPAQPTHVSEPAPEPEPAPSPAPTPTPQPTAAPGAGDLAAVDITTEVVGTFNSPLAMRVRPGTDQVWVVERAGTIRTLEDEPRTVLDITDRVSTNGERGLLGLAFDAGGEVLYTSSTATDGASVIDAFDIVDGVADVDTRRQLLRVEQPASNHNGGDLHRGPDGHLWWALGDGGGANDQYDNGQRSDTLLGTIVRIAPSTGASYTIPDDNPFADGDGGAAEVWAFGLRNPWRIAFDSDTGELYIADVGQGDREEINVVTPATAAGSNFGWPVFEGTQVFAGGDLDDHTPPVFETDHADGNCSITGGVVYRGDAIPDLQGAYLFSDLCNNEIRAITVQGGETTQQADLGSRVGTPVGFGVDAEGEVHVLSLGGDIVKIVPA